MTTYFNSKRILRDIKAIETSNNKTIFLRNNNNNDIGDLEALIIGPSETVFQGGFFHFKIKLPSDYPFNPPTVTFISPRNPDGRLHPNLYACGKVCLSILGTWHGNDKWSPLLTLEKLLITIQCLLDNNPIHHEPAYYKMS